MTDRLLYAQEEQKQVEKPSQGWRDSLVSNALASFADMRDLSLRPSIHMILVLGK